MTLTNKQIAELSAGIKGKLSNIADAIRSVTGGADELTIDEMIQAVMSMKMKEPAKYRVGRLACGTRAHVLPNTYAHTNTWVKKEWNISNNDRSISFGSYVWSDGTNIYYSNYEDQFVLNNDIWERKTWNVEIHGNWIWTDGVNIYYVYDGRYHYVLNGDTWERKYWNNVPLGFYSKNVWSDGTNIYYSEGEAQFVLNGNTWEKKNWNNAEKVHGKNVWSDGANIFATYNSVTYVLNDDTWEVKTFNGNVIGVGSGIWTDGKNIYYSHFTKDRYILNGDTWETMTWNVASDLSLTTMYGNNIWTDGTSVYWDNFDAYSAVLV